MFGASLALVALFAASGGALVVETEAVGVVAFVMSFTPWLLNDLSIKAGGQGVSGEILEGLQEMWVPTGHQDCERSKVSDFKGFSSPSN
jgi:hypothetical protein